MIYYFCLRNKLWDFVGVACKGAYSPIVNSSLAKKLARQFQKEVKSQSYRCAYRVIKRPVHVDTFVEQMVFYDNLAIAITDKSFLIWIYSTFKKIL